MGTGEVPAKDFTSSWCTRTRTRTRTGCRVVLGGTGQTEPEPATGGYMVRKTKKFNLLHAFLQVQSAEHLDDAYPLPAPQAEK